MEEKDREKLLDDVALSYSDQYKLLLDTWKNIESKAQATTTAAGIFLAAAFALTREGLDQTSPAETATLLLSLLLLILTVGSAIFSMRISTVEQPPQGSVLKEIVFDRLETDRTPQEAYLRTLISLWDKANEETILKLEDKAMYVGIAQSCLFLSALLFLLFTTIHATGVAV